MTMSRRLDGFLARVRMLLDPVPPPLVAGVPACRCFGRCRCGGQVPTLLLRQIEQECEFFRAVM